MEFKPKVHIAIQRRNAKNSITLISGLDSDLDLQRILKGLKKTLATNGTILEDDSQKILQLQGDKREEASSFLVSNNICSKDRIIVHGY